MMNYIKNTILIIILSIFTSSQLFSSNLIKEMDSDSNSAKSTNIESTQGKYNIEDTTQILKNGKLGKLKLDHDDHVYRFMKISKYANDLEGAVDVLIAAQTKLGYTLDDDEVDIIIKISKQDTNLYKEVLETARKIGKKKTTVKEHFTISQEFSKGNGKYLLTGIERSIECNYKIKNDYFTWNRINLLINIGKLENEDRFMDIYQAMKSVGMSSKINPKGLEVIYKLCKVKGDVAYKITGYLKSNNWKSRKQPGDREYLVIKDLMKANYTLLNQKSDFDNPEVIKLKAKTIKVKPKTIKTKKKVTKRMQSKKRKRTRLSKNCHKKRSNPCLSTLSKNNPYLSTLD